MKWDTNDTNDEGTYKIKITGKIHSLNTGKDYFGSIQFYIKVAQ